MDVAQQIRALTGPEVEALPGNHGDPEYLRGITNGLLLALSFAEGTKYTPIDGPIGLAALGHPVEQPQVAVPLRIHAHGGAGIHDYEMSDGTIKTMSQSEARELVTNTTTPIVGYILKTGHGTGFKESLPDDAEYAHMWRAVSYTKDAPIKMILHCPQCHTQHIDAPERSLGPGNTENLDWDNPPHRSHLCHTCNHIWRPADIATEGVAAIETRGKHDHGIGSDK